MPLLELDNGERLTEGPAIVQYIADQVPAKKLAPAAGTMARYRLQEWLNFITTELHKGFSPLFNPATPEDTKAVSRNKLLDRLTWVDEPAGRQALPDGRQLHRGRRLPVHRRQLGPVRRRRHLGLAQPEGLHGAACARARPCRPR